MKFKILRPSHQQTIPKQVFDIVNVANSVDNLSHSYKRQLELNTLTSQSSTHSFSNIQINGVTLKCKQDTGAEVCVMPLNIFDRLNSKLNGGLKLCPVTDMSKSLGTANRRLRLLAKLQSVAPILTLLKSLCLLHHEPHR